MDNGSTRSAWPPHSYENLYFLQGRYESVVLSRQMVDQIRAIPTLRLKGHFAYECLLKRAITRCCMQVHAVLSFYKECKLFTTEERMARWLHRLDV